MVGSFSGMCCSRKWRSSASSWGFVECARPGYIRNSTLCMPAANPCTHHFTSAHDLGCRALDSNAQAPKASKILKLEYRRYSLYFNPKATLESLCRNGSDWCEITCKTTDTQ